MSRRLSSQSPGVPAERRGIVLLVVMAMLALFATVGLSFVFYSDAQWIASYYHRQSLTQDLSDVPPERLFNFFLSQQIYGTSNTGSGLRGHDFASSMYGVPGGTSAFSGPGRIYSDNTDSLGAGLDVARKSRFLNHTFFQTLGETAAREPFEGGNAPYTYPDNNSPFLAALRWNSTSSAWELTARSYDRNQKATSATSNDYVDFNKTSDAYQRFYTLRPHKVYHTNFASPARSTNTARDPNTAVVWDGDVRNLEGVAGFVNPEGGYFYGDSFWIDLGFPVMTAKDGTKYKPLFAPLILDLDNRVNLSAVANYLATYTGATPAVSMWGLGPHEINPAKILTASEISYLWSGWPTNVPSGAPGRNGNDNTPDNATAVTMPNSPYYGKLNFGGTSAQNIQFPSVGADPAMVTKFEYFPTYAADWTNLTAGTATPFGFDPLMSSPGDGFTATDSPFRASNMEALLRYGERGSPNLTSNLQRLMPNSFDMVGGNGKRNRHLVTTLSTALDVPHLAPFFNGTDANTTYELNAGNYPKSTAAGMSVVREQTIPAAASFNGSGEYSAGFRSRTAALKRLNLQYPLTAYTANAATALTDRQTFAKELYKRLCMSTTGGTIDVSTKADTNPEYKAARWLAQLAVNIVDFVDEDEKMTMFNWNTKNDGTLEYVCGHEQPRLLINEMYVSYDNDKDDPGLTAANIANMMTTATKYRMNVWAELFNPMNTATVLKDPGANGRIKYRLVLATQAPAATDSPFGEPSNVYTDNGMANGTKLIVSDWTTGSTADDPGMAGTPGASVNADNGALNSNGFYLVGPKDHFLNVPGAMLKPDFPSLDFYTEMMSYKRDLPANDVAPQMPTPVLILQRLANPDMNEDANPSNVATYNPFVTVDVFQGRNGVDGNDAIKFIGTNPPTLPKPILLSNLKSQMRKQPMWADRASLKDPALNPANMGQKPQNTFARHNSIENSAPVDSTDPMQTLSLPFTWMPHLDRPLASLPEILNVAAVGPDRVTREFPFTGGQNLFHESLSGNESLVWRFLETVSVPDRTYRPQLNIGQISIRTAGKINVNTVADKLVVQALADHRSISNFTAADVDNLFTYITTNRPFAGLGDFQAKVSGANSVIELKTPPTSSLVTGTPGDCSDLFKKTELARKLLNNITYTSNTFAVWVTVGFFAVDDANATPPKLGAEIGLSENRNVRHRMFAIVDRSKVVAPDYAFLKLSAGATAGNNATVSVTGGDPEPSVTPKVKANWTVRKGLRLIIDRGGANEEAVEVLGPVTGTTFVANLTKNHAANEKIHLDGHYSNSTGNGQAPWANTILAHPGPQPEFNVRDYSYVVPYFTIID